MYRFQPQNVHNINKCEKCTTYSTHNITFHALDICVYRKEKPTNKPLNKLFCTWHPDYDTMHEQPTCPL